MALRSTSVEVAVLHALLEVGRELDLPSPPGGPDHRPHRTMALAAPIRTRVSTPLLATGERSERGNGPRWVQSHGCYALNFGMRPGPSASVLVLALAGGACFSAHASKPAPGGSPSAAAPVAASPPLSASKSAGARTLPPASSAPGCSSGTAFGPSPSTESGVKQLVARAIDTPMVGHTMLLKAWPRRPGASVALVIATLETFRKPEQLDAHVVLLDRNESVMDVVATGSLVPMVPTDPAWELRSPSSRRLRGVPDSRRRVRVRRPLRTRHSVSRRREHDRGSPPLQAGLRPSHRHPSPRCGRTTCNVAPTTTANRRASSSSRPKQPAASMTSLSSAGSPPLLCSRITQYLWPEDRTQRRTMEVVRRALRAVSEIGRVAGCLRYRKRGRPQQESLFPVRSPRSRTSAAIRERGGRSTGKD